MELSNDIIDWFNYQYLKGVNLINSEGSKKYNDLIKSFPAESTSNEIAYPISGIARMWKFLSLKYTYNMCQEGYVCAALITTVDSTKINIGYAYWRNGKIEGYPEYICVSPSSTSHNREYRSRFYIGAVFRSTCEKLSKDLSIYEQIITNLMGTNISLDINTYPSEVHEKVHTLCVTQRIHVHVFSALLMMDSYNIVNDRNIYNVSSNYIEAIKFISGHNQSIAKNTNKLFENTINKFKLPLEVCQIVAPMKLYEVASPFDENYKIWKSLLVNQLVTDLVINFISPSFPLFNQWTYISGTNANFYDNSHIQKKYKISVMSENTVKHLQRAAEDLSLNTVESFELESKLRADLHYAQSKILLSNISQLHTMENVGIILSSIPKYMGIHPDKSEEIINNMRGFIFDALYSSHCMHAKLSIIHANIKPTHITYHKWGSTEKHSYKNPMTAFIMGDNGDSDTFLFQSTGSNICLIDYGNSIIGPNCNKIFEYYGKDPIKLSNFYRDQSLHIISLLKPYMEDSIDSDMQNILHSIISNYNNIFPILCALDIIAIGESFSSIFPENKEIFDLAKSIEIFGREHLISGIKNIIKDPKISIKYPGELAIYKFFSENTFNALTRKFKNEIDLVDIYNFKNEMEYSTLSYSTYPQWAKLDEIDKHAGGMKLTDIFSIGIDVFIDSLKNSTYANTYASKVKLNI